MHREWFINEFTLIAINYLPTLLVNYIWICLWTLLQQYVFSWCHCGKINVGLWNCQIFNRYLLWSAGISIYWLGFLVVHTLWLSVTGCVACSSNLSTKSFLLILISGEAWICTLFPISTNLKYWAPINSSYLFSSSVSNSSCYCLSTNVIFKSYIFLY